LSDVEVVVPGDEVRTAGGERFRREVEARRSRHRLYPVSVLYTLSCLTILVCALRSARPFLGAASYALGLVAWTWLEYFIHRRILHGRFPDGPGLARHVLHKAFDHLHWEHHKRPWDGNHINGTIKDSLPLVGPIVALSFLAPVWSLPTFLAGVLQAAMIEEWVHHSVHFYNFDNLYFRYIKRHHLYHHSPKGMNIAYGLTNGFWDIVYDTRISADVRQALYEPLRRRSRRDAYDDWPRLRQV
jgi:sterol desaturase/sphingolipid hydroxylase (fatty acid hydroxylase superfamily)